MAPKQTLASPHPINIAVLTISDTRTASSDTSGDLLVERLQRAGHALHERCIVTDNRYLIRSKLSQWIAAPTVNVILTTGGTGITTRDITPEAVRPLLDKEIEGFGEAFRWLSYADIQTSSLQSRALAGIANGTYLFCMPGSTHACATGWDKIIQQQLDYTHTPCNLVELIARATPHLS